MKRYLLLKNARIADTAKRSLCDSDILIRQKSDDHESEIIAIGDNISIPPGEDIILKMVNLHGQIVCPSFIDMRCDICEPGNRNREDFESLGAAASAGGFSSLVSLPLTGLTATDEIITDYIIQNEHRTGGVRILPSVPVTVGGSPDKLSDFDALISKGAVAFYDDGSADTPTLLRAMKICAEKDLLLITHCEERSLIGDGVMNSGAMSKMLGLKAIPASAEEIAIARNLILAEETGCRIHVSHISTARSADMIRSAKAIGISVTCDTAVQYFALSEGDIPFYSENAKVFPPLRSEKDRSAIINAIKDKTIDCICSDHTPRSEHEKPHDIIKALPGITGLQTAFTVALDRLVMGGHIDIFRLIELFSNSPAKIIGSSCELRVGQRAYLNVFSLDHDTFFQSANAKSKSKNSPFLETSFRGCLTYSVTDGVLNQNPDISVF